jgi:hypothetical protein
MRVESPLQNFSSWVTRQTLWIWWAVSQKIHE